MGDSINIARIIIPDSSPLFLVFIGIHVSAASVSLITGVLAMLSKKTGGKHPNFGTIYFWSLSVVFVTSIGVSFIRWPFDNYLVVLGVLSFGFALAGRLAQRNKWRYRMRVHLVCMSLSFILLLTGFYVDNGKNLPLWKLLPDIAYWTLPALIGIPIVVYVLLHHPLTRLRK